MEMYIISCTINKQKKLFGKIAAGERKNIMAFTTSGIIILLMEAKKLTRF